jgi:hypothetical protein
MGNIDKKIEGENGGMGERENGRKGERENARKGEGHSRQPKE